MSELMDVLEYKDDDEYHAPKYGEIHASSLGFCERRTWYLIHRYEEIVGILENRRRESMLVNENYRMLVGTLLHEGIEKQWMAKFGKRIKIEKRLKPLKVGRKVRIMGKVDAIYEDEEGKKWLIDIKTMEYVFDGMGVKEAHKSQLGIYLLMLERMGIEIDKVMIFYVSRTVPNNKEREWKGMVEIELDKEELKEEGRRQIETLKRILQGGKKPRRLKDWHCAYCYLAEYCYGDDDEEEAT